MRFIQKTFLVCIIFGSTLIFNPWLSTQVFEWPKLIFFLGSVTLFSLYNIFDFVRSPSSSFSYRSLLDQRIIFLALFLAGHSLAYGFSTDHSVSLIGSSVRLQGFLVQLFYVVFGCNVWYVFSKEHSLNSKNTYDIVGALLVLLVVGCVAALAPYVFPTTLHSLSPSLFRGRVFGTLGNPNYLASFIITLLPFLALAGKEVCKKTFAKFLLWPSGALVLITLFLTGSRASWLAAILGFGSWGIFISLRRREIKILLATISAALLLVIGFFIRDYLTPYAPQFGRLAIGTPETSSIQPRFVLWQTGLRMATNKPFTGFGQDMIEKNIESFLPPNLRANPIFYIDRIHNEYIDILVATGIFTLIGYYGLICIMWYRGLQRYRHHEDAPTAAALVSLMILLLFQAVNFSTITSNVLLVFLLSYLGSQSRLHTTK